MKISLDFWNTICISNPEFSKARKLLCREYSIDIELINNYKQSYLELEKRGIHLHRETFLTDFEFIDDMNQLFLKYPPIPIYKDIMLDILNLRQDHHSTDLVFSAITLGVFLIPILFKKSNKNYS